VAKLLPPFQKKNYLSDILGEKKKSSEHKVSQPKDADPFTIAA
jgi:hypothetical protein